MSQGRNVAQGEMSLREKCRREKSRREKCLLGRNVAPDIFDQKSREKSKSGRNVAGRNVAGRNVAGRNVSQGEMSFSHRIHMRLYDIFQIKGPFANKVVILVGDLLQVKQT